MALIKSAIGESASLAKFLITEDSSWVTGQIIAIDGGRSKLS